MKCFSVLILSAASLTVLNTSALADTWDGGSGTWDNGVTADWDNGGTWTNGDQAYFLSAPGLVTVNNTNGGPVSFSYLEVNASSSGTLDFEGDPLTTTSPYFNIDSGDQAAVTFGSTLQENASVGGFHFGNASSQNLVINNLTMTGSATNFGEFHADTYGTGEIIFDGTITPGPGGGKLMFSEYGGGSGLYQVNGNVSALTNGLETAGGTILLGANVNLGSNSLSTFGGSATAHGFLTNGAMTVSAGLTVSDNGNPLGTQGGLGMFGGNTADVSTFSGNMGVFDNADLELTAATGGRVNFTGNIGGEIGGGMIKTGGGTVVLGSNNYGIGVNNNDDGTVAADIQAGTVLITNGVGTSAFGNNHGTVTVEAGTTLGGTGYTGSTQKVVAAGATSVVTAGMANTVGTLHLDGGLAAANGITMNFTLDGTNPNSVIDLAGSTLQLNGNLTFNFTNIGGALSLNQNYVIFTGIDPDSNIFGNIEHDTFIFNAPAGYTVDASTYPVIGTDANDTNETLYVRFEAAPEPSTYALMLGGLALLAFCVRRKLA